jgi:hypothetical protein
MLIASLFPTWAAWVQFALVICAVLLLAAGRWPR